MTNRKPEIESALDGLVEAGFCKGVLFALSRIKDEQRRFAQEGNAEMAAELASLWFKIYDAGVSDKFRSSVSPGQVARRLTGEPQK